MSLLKAEIPRKLTFAFTCFLAIGFAASRCRAADAKAAMAQPHQARVVAAPSAMGSRHATANLTERRSATPLRLMDKSTRRIPLTFTPNVGQAAEQTQFLAVGKGFSLSLEKNGLTFATRVPEGSTNPEGRSLGVQAALKSGGPELPQGAPRRWREQDVHLEFLGTRGDSRIEGLDAAIGKVNYFLGSDPSEWRRNVPAYSRVRYSQIYPGVDMVFYGRKDGGLEYDLVVAAGTDPQQIRFRVSADQKPMLDADGSLQLDGKDGKLSLNRPLLYQNIDGGKRMIAGSFMQVAENEFAFQVTGYDRTKTLIIDPAINLVYSTYLGGRHPDDANNIALDAAGNAYIVGSSASEDFPISGNAYQPIRSALGTETYDAVIMKFDASGVLRYSTFLGGTNNEFGQSIAIDSAGDAYISGSTLSTDLPTTANAYQSSTGGGFLAEIGPDGSTLLYSSYYPAAVQGIAFNSQGKLVLFGTSGPGLTTTVGSYKPALTQGNAAFVTILDLTKAGSAQLSAATYYGTDSPVANNTLTGNSLIGHTFDSTGNVWIGGQAYTPNLPTTGNAYQTSLPAINGSCQGNGVALNGAAYIAELSADLSTLVYATYFSGQTTGATINDCSEFVTHLAFDSNGSLYAAGGTASATFPVTTGVFQAANPGGGGSSGFVTWVAKFAANTPAPTWSSYFGGNGGNTFFSGSGRGIAVDAAHNVWISGQTAGGSNFPISTPAYQSAYGGGSEDGFVSEISADGKTVLYSTYLGGSGYDAVNAMALDASINIYVAGSTLSSNFPVTANAFQGVFGEGCPSGCDGNDMFFAILGSGTITSIGPMVAGNTGDTTITVNGAGFEDGATCELVQGTTIITALQATVNATGTSISCTFALNGATTGSYNVVVNNPGGGATFTQKDALTVQSGGHPDLSVSIVGRPKIRTGVPFTFYINVTNSGNEEAYFVPLWVTLPMGITFSINGYTEAESAFLATNDGTLNYVNLLLNQIHPGQTLPIPLQITTAADTASIPLTATLQPPWFSTVAEIQAANTAATLPGSCVASTTNSYALNCLGAHLAAVAAGQRLFAPAVGPLQAGRSLHAPRRLDGGAPCAPPPQEKPQKYKDGYQAGFSDGATAGKTPNPYWLIDLGNWYNWQDGYAAGNFASTQGLPAAYIVAGAHPPIAFESLMGRAVPLAASGESACPVPPPPLPPPGGSGSSSGGAIDPNYKSGSMGDNSASAYVRGTAALSYSVGFENEATATLPAATVVVTDQLDPAKVDLSTLTLGTITFGTNVITLPSGTNNYSTTYTPTGVTAYAVRIQGSLNISTGLLKWTFQTIDPATGLPPSDPTIGFLPPDVDGIVGQGSAQFTVMPKSGQASGTPITNSASVVFDVNAPIQTPMWLNTLDSTRPASSVTALPATEDGTSGTATFTVSWSGTDADSGINSYTVYVSDNGGAFAPWQNATTATSDIYTGTVGHTYGFYSIAADNAGNVEAPKSSAEASTEVTASVAVTLSPTTLDFGGVNLGAASAVKTVTLTNAGTQTLTISGIAASGDFSQTNTCGTSVAASASCTISVTFTPAATGPGTGAITITDNAPDSPQSVPLTGAGQDFTLAAAAGSATSASVSAGSPASYTLSVTGEGGLTGNVSFSCTGAPSYSTCAVSPNPATVGNSAINVGVTVNTTAPSGFAPRFGPVSPSPLVPPGVRNLLMLSLLLLAFAWAVMRWKAAEHGRWRFTIIPLTVGLLMTLALAGCGSGGGGGGGMNSNPGTPTGTYTLTVTATSGSGASALTHNVSLTLMVK